MRCGYLRRESRVRSVRSKETNQVRGTETPARVAQDSRWLKRKSCACRKWHSQDSNLRLAFLPATHSAGLHCRLIVELDSRAVPAASSPWKTQRSPLESRPWTRLHT